MKNTIALLFLTSFSIAAHADFGKQVKVVNEWTVYKKIDVMTDQTECLAIYDGKKDIQLTADTLAFGQLGYAQAYKYRLDDEPLSSLKLNDDVPKRMGVVLFEGPMFEQIKSSKRFRLQVTATSLQTFDMNTSSISSVLTEFKTQGCKGS